MAISLRHGQLVAAVGIVGAFVTPALVQTANPSLPGLFGYLLFVTATALAVVRYTAWIWLGWATTIAGAIWVLLAIAAGTDSDIWAPALFVPAAAALNLGLLPGAALEHPIGRRLAWVPCAALGAMGLLLAVLDQGWTARIGVLLFVPLTIWQAARENRLRLLPFLAALLFLLLLAGWSIEIRDWPDIAIPPGTWTPAVVRALLATAALVSGCFAASGLWFERRTVHPLPWASLAASVPVLTLAICYARVAEFEPSAGWAVFAMLLAAGLTGCAAAALREVQAGSRERAGIHAAGAVAALALGCAMLLRDQWLSLAVSLFLPALAWVAAQVELPATAPGGACRRLAGAGPAAAELIRARLRVRPLAGGERIARGLCGARRRFRRWPPRCSAAGRTTSPSGCWRPGAWPLRRCLWPWRSGRAWDRRPACDAPEFGFPEAALDVASLAVLAVATMRIAERLRRPVLHWGMARAGRAGACRQRPADPRQPAVHRGRWATCRCSTGCCRPTAAGAAGGRGAAPPGDRAAPDSAAVAGRVCAGCRVCLDHAGGPAPVPSRLRSG